MPNNKNKQGFTVGIVAVAVILGAYMIFVESKAPTPTDTTDVAVWSLSDNEAKDLNALSFTAGAQSVNYTRTGDTWHAASAPTRTLDYSWQPAYSNLKDLTATRKVETHAKNLATYGLEKPALTVVWGGSKSPYRFEVGDQTPTKDAYYAHVDKDDTIYTLASYKVDGWKSLALKAPLTPLPSPAPSPVPAASGASGVVNPIAKPPVKPIPNLLPKPILPAHKQ